MTTNEKISKKMCCFYASDFHLEMTILPYINKKIEENKKVIVVTQNNLEESVKILISKINLKNKEKLLKIDWNNKSIENIKKQKDAIIIVNGNKNFIKEITLKINEMKNGTGSQIEQIDCYLFDEIKNEMSDIRDEYEAAINNLQKNT